MVITLIDDVYLLWHETTKRAAGFPYKGEPTLAQLLETRRAEIFLGELISKQVEGSDEPIPYYVVSTWHPARILDRLIFNHRNLRIGYMAFPISRPRKAKRAGDPALITELNSYFEKISEFEARHPNVAFFCPLCIDELPLVDNELTYQELKKERPGEAVEVVTVCDFQTSLRWAVTDFYKDTTLLTDAHRVPPEIAIPKEQIDLAEGFIRGDVATRDYRLVGQSDFLAVLNPIVPCPGEPDRIASGVRNEIHMAMHEGKPIHVYQNPKHDPTGVFRKLYDDPSSSMGGNPPGWGNVRMHDSVDALLKQSMKDHGFRASS